MQTNSGECPPDQVNDVILWQIEAQTQCGIDNHGKFIQFSQLA